MMQLKIRKCHNINVSLTHVLSEAPKCRASVNTVLTVMLEMVKQVYLNVKSLSKLKDYSFK